MKKLFKKILLIITVFSPAVVLAQGSLGEVAFGAIQLVNYAIPLIIAVGLLVFLWGVYKYIFANEDDKKDSVYIITTGLIILTVMVSVWGLVYLYSELFGVNIYSGNVPLPQKPINIFQLISK
jgi:hypothetical protein